MPTVVKMFGVKEALHAFRELPRRVHFKHLKIALNAGGGVIRDRAVILVRRRTGILARSLAVGTPVIPDASFNQAHHGKPAYVKIGPKTKAGRFLRLTAKGLLRGFGAAQKALMAERKRLAAGKIGKPLERERAAVRAVKAGFGGGLYISPSRYAHLLEKGHRRGAGRSAARAYPFLSTAVNQTKMQALARVEEKLRIGLNTEAHALGQQGHSVALGVG
jgi:hypothetical protein